MNTNNELPKSIKLNEHGTGLRVALHLQFHRKAYELISAVDKKKLHLTNDLLNDWKHWIDIEVDLSLEAKTSVLTAKLRDLDKQRDELILYLFKTIHTQTKSPITATAEAAQRLHIVTDTYKNLHKKAYEAESALVVGLLHDLAKQPRDLTVLGLQPALEQLETVNRAYEEVRVRRRAETVASKLPNLRKVRPQTDAAYDLVCQHISAAYLYAGTDADRKAIALLTAQINQTMADFKLSSHESKAQRKSKKNKE